ncbi:MAG: hypothetical protein WCO25_05495 [Candidatus Uhrbacteria bacterium]
MHRILTRLRSLLTSKRARFGALAILVSGGMMAAAHPALAGSLSLTNTLLSIFAAIAMAMAEVIGKLVVAVLDITIPIMQYQGFTSSPVVNTGWAIVRDVVNMFFVVILIIVAMQTIFGVAKTEWRQQVPKIMVMAIVINFSKTLCGIMIDFAQVIMLTFANALKDIAGGNFIQMLGLGDIFSLSAKADQFANSADGVAATGTSAFDLFAAGVAAVFMMVWVLAVVMILLCVLVYRVVMLWILIVMAPLAWFTKVVPFDQAKGSYADWWKNFICYCSIGPVLTFFLWLTLAVAGSGFIASQDSGFSAVAPQGEVGIASGMITSIFEWQSLLSFVIGMAMLMAGMDAASKICSGVKGGVGSLLAAGKGGGFINQFAGAQARKYGDKGTKWAGGKVKAGGAALAGGAGDLALGAGAAGLAIAGSKMATGKADWSALKMTREGQAARAQGMRDLSKKMPASMAGTARALSMSADARQADLATTMKKSAEETYKGASDETKVDELVRMANGGGQAFEGAASQGLLAEAIKNPKMREKLEASGALKKLVDGGQIDGLKKALKGTKDFEAIEDMEKGRPDLFNKFDKIDSTNAKDLDVAAYADQKVKNRLAEVESDIYDKNEYVMEPDGSGGFKNKLDDKNEKVKGRYLTEKEAVERGKRGKKKQDAINGKGRTGVHEGLSPANLALVPLDELAANPTPKLVEGRADLASRLMNSDDPSDAAKLADQKLFQAAAKSALGFKFDATGNFDGADPAKLKAAVKSNPNVLSNIPSSMLSDPKVQSAIAGAVDIKAAEGLVKSYKKATPEQRTKMDNGVLNVVLPAITEAADTDGTRGNTSEYQTQAGEVEDYMSEQLKNIKADETASNLTSATYTVTVATEDLARIQKSLNSVLAEIPVATADANNDRVRELEDAKYQLEEGKAQMRSRLAEARAVVSRGGKRA